MPIVHVKQTVAKIHIGNTHIFIVHVCVPRILSHSALLTFLTALHTYAINGTGNRRHLLLTNYISFEVI